MKHSWLSLTAGLAALLVASGVAWAQNQDEAKCQQGASLALGKFFKEKTKCAFKCQKKARKEINPVSDCSPPFAGEMASCVTTAENKETGLIGSKCAKDCPECYADGDCSAFAIAEVASVEAEIDAMIPLIYCDDSASADALNKFEASEGKAPRRRHPNGEAREKATREKPCAADTDTTVNTVYGRQVSGRESSNPKNRGRCRCQPIVSFIVETGELLLGNQRNDDKPRGPEVAADSGEDQHPFRLIVNSDSGGI